MTTIPYLHFQGTCAEALAFYADVFGGTGLQTMTYAQMPEAPEAWHGSRHVMHGQITIGDGALMASDFPPGMEGDRQQAAAVMQSVADPAEAARVFDRLAEGGAIIDAIRPTFFSPAFGMVKDRFGTHWYISALPPAGAA